MKKVIYAEQTLHGYANGHQLLASSYTLELSDRKRMDELSDLSGRCSEEEFIDYYTGYPIENGKKYVLSKTWYANEMKRPGCVWTHSLLFRTEDLHCLSDISELMASFQRPCGFTYERYTHPVPLVVEGKRRFPAYDIQQLQYGIFTVCSSATPKYILVEADTVQFENELFMVLCSLPQDIMKSFTFCTMAYDVRKYKDNLFQYQILPKAGRNDLVQYYTSAQHCEKLSAIKKYPYWIQCYMRILLRDTLQPLHNFIRQYGTDYMTLEYYSQFSRLYFALTGETKISLTEFIYSHDVLFPSDCMVVQKTIELVLEDKFSPAVFAGQEYQLLEIMEMKRLSLGKKQQRKLQHKVVRDTPEKLYPYLKRYITGTLPVCICDFLEDAIQALSPDALYEVSSMERNICFVLIRKNPNMLLCSDIWRQPKDFQQEMICAISQDLQPEVLQKLLITVLQVDEENVAENLYQAFGAQMLPPLYHALALVGMPFRGRLDDWTSVLLKDQQQLLEKILILPSTKWRQELFLKVDMNAKGLVQGVKKDVWLCLYQELFVKETLSRNMTDIAIQFFPAIFCTEYRFEDTFIRDIVGIIYQEVKSNMMRFDTWSRFQQLLPQVEDYQAWDRCLRIRRGLEEKGYQVSLVES